MPMRSKSMLEREPVTILATGSDAIEAPFDGKVVEVTYIPIAPITGAASPASRTLSVVDRGQDGLATVVVASLPLVAGVNIAAFDERVIPLSVVANATSVSAGDVLEFRSAAVGATGLVDPGGTIQIVFERNN